MLKDMPDDQFGFGSLANQHIFEGLLSSVGVLHQFYRSPIDLYKCYDDTIAWAVRLNDDVLTNERAVKVINLKSDMGNQLDQIGIWSVFPISLPLNSEWIVLVIRYGNLQMRKINLTLKVRGCRDTNMIEFHSVEIRC